MRIQVVFLLAAGLLGTTPAVAQRAADERPRCFDFDQAEAVSRPLREPLFLRAGGTDAQEYGKAKEDDMTWAAVRGLVARPIGEVYRLLLDHKNTQSSRVNETTVEKIAKPGYLEFHHVSFLIKPFLFMKVRWTEAWGFALVNGTVDKPETIVVSYEKIEGTDYIRHLCGSAVLRRVSEKVTDTYLYEEAIATQRSVDDTLSGMKGTLETLRRGKPTTPP